MPPILVAHLFPDISRHPAALLRSLAPADWHAPTVSSRRTVKDMVSHLLDGSLRRLSLQRDGVARDYPEKWHHTQQLFTATGRPSTILGGELYHPCLDALLLALPFAFRSVDADAGAVVAVKVTGGAGGRRGVVRRADGWVQVPDPPAATATVTLSPDTAWRLLTKRRTRAATLAEFPDIRIAGDRRLGEHALDTVAVMA